MPLLKRQSWMGGYSSIATKTSPSAPHSKKRRRISSKNKRKLLRKSPTKGNRTRRNQTPKSQMTSRTLLQMGLGATVEKRRSTRPLAVHGEKRLGRKRFDAAKVRLSRCRHVLRVRSPLGRCTANGFGFRDHAREDRHTSRFAYRRRHFGNQGWQDRC